MLRDGFFLFNQYPPDFTNGQTQEIAKNISVTLKKTDLAEALSCLLRHWITLWLQSMSCAIIASHSQWCRLRTVNSAYYFQTTKWRRAWRAERAKRERRCVNPLTLTSAAPEDESHDSTFLSSEWLFSSHPCLSVTATTPLWKILLVADGLASQLTTVVNETAICQWLSPCSRPHAASLKSFTALTDSSLYHFGV